MSNKQQEWIDKHPLTWAAINAVGNFIIFVLKVRIALSIIYLLEVWKGVSKW